MNKGTILKFMGAINCKNLSIIIEMMSEDFLFIDTYGDSANKEQMKTGWQGFFNWFPDYQMEVNAYLENEEFAVILGNVRGSYWGNKDKYWCFPAAWKVVAKGKQICIWQVFCASVSSVKEYLMYSDRVNEKLGSCEERLRAVQGYVDKGEEAELFKAITNMSTEHEQIYMEIGIQAGFRLAKDIIQGNVLEESALVKYKEMYLSLFEDITKVVSELKKAQRRAEEIYISI